MAEAPPRFDQVLRGYDRAQVDAYVAKVTRELAEAGRATAGREAAGEPAREEAEDAAPDFSPLGERIVRLLALAEEDARERRRRGEEEAQGILDEAKAQADDIRRTAAGEAEDLRAAVRGAKAEAEAITAKARKEAEELLQRGRRHAEDQAERIVADAEARAQRALADVAEVTRAREQEWEERRREHETAIAALEERHDRILSGLAQLRASLDADPPVVARRLEDAGKAQADGAGEHPGPGQEEGDDAVAAQPSARTA
jgi:DivIVA domain-containing protein